MLSGEKNKIWFYFRINLKYITSIMYIELFLYMYGYAFQCVFFITDRNQYICVYPLLSSLTKIFFKRLLFCNCKRAECNWKPDVLRLYSSEHNRDSSQGCVLIPANCAQLIGLNAYMLRHRDAQIQGCWSQGTLNNPGMLNPETLHSMHGCSNPGTLKSEEMSTQGCWNQSRDV